MFRNLRWLHKWGGIIACVFLLGLAITGVLLAFKSRAAWIRPETQDGTSTEITQIISLEQAAESAYSAGLDEIQSIDDIDRFEYRAKDGIFKITSKDGYKEVQVDGATGEVLGTGIRNDQFFEDLHDLSFFSDFLKDYWLPVVGGLLALLSISGIFMFFTPYTRRWKFKREQAKKGK